MATWTNVSKNTTTWTNDTESLVGHDTAEAGQLMISLLPFIYAGDEILTQGTEITWANQSKNSSTYTNLTKN